MEDYETEAGEDGYADLRHQQHHHHHHKRERATDFMDTESVLINPVDSYVGKYIGQFLSDKRVGSTQGAKQEDSDSESEDEYESTKGGVKKNWKILGTVKDNKSQVPTWLWAIMRSDDPDAYLHEIHKCRVIIYDITEDPTPERFAEIRAVTTALNNSAATFRSQRMFILISTVHTWSHTETKHPNDYLSEDDYRRRRTKPQYRELQLLERQVIDAGRMTHGMLKSYVIGAGAVYGADEGPLHHWFKSAWHNALYLPIYGNGKNFLPTIYIKDLARIVQNVMDSTPKKQRYILAVDPTVCQLDQIVKAISHALGTGRAKKVLEDAQDNKELTTFQADQLLLNLKMETTFCKDNFQMEFTADKGFTSIINKLVAEYKKTRSLQPLKVIVLGPPGVGKSTIAKQLSDMYRLNHFTKEDMIKSTIQMLRDIVGGDLKEPDIIDSEGQTGNRKEDARALLSQVETSLSNQGSDDVLDAQIPEVKISTPTSVTNEIATNKEPEVKQPSLKNYEELEDSLVCKLYRYRLLTNQCQNQGFVLDGFPETFEEARRLFLAGDDAEEFYGEDAGDDGKDALDSRLVPDKVIMLEAPDEFLTHRLLTIPLEQLQPRHLDEAYPKTLSEYREKLADFENSSLYYLDMQEMLYSPIDITVDTSPMNLSTIGKISDIVGKPRNYGISIEEETALKNAEPLPKEKKINKFDLAQIESKELEERRNNTQKWLEMMAKIKREEFERDEAEKLPLRHYLMAHVVPVLTKGLMEATTARPYDPLEFMGEFLFQHNPEIVNCVNACAHKYQEDANAVKNLSNI